MTDARTYRAVVADDVATLRELLRIVLERSGRFTVVAEAGNGAEALAATREHQPDLTLLDLSMPVMDGLEALPLIRNAVPSTMVIVLSGFDADRMAKRALEAGATAYMVKGLTPTELVERLLDLLEHHEPPPTSLDDGDAPPGDDVLVELPEELGSASKARSFVRRVLEGWNRHDLADDAMLLTTELVTNAVVHAESAVHVRVLSVDGGVRVEVADFGRGALTLKKPGTDATSGRGLLLVKELARTWGTSADGREKVVWFEL